MRLQSKSQTSAELAERVRSILETRELTLYQVSQKSEALYGHSSPYFLPHNFYYDLKLGTFSPNLYQVFALSRISNYRLSDWLHVLGFNLEDIPRLQVLLPQNRTILLDHSLNDPDARVPWFRNKPGNMATPPIAPLGQLLEFGYLVHQYSLLELNKQRFVYAKIGLQDALAFPDLLPGSIVRADPRITTEGIVGENGKTSDRLFLIEHRKGLFCCRLQLAGRHRALPVSSCLPYAQVELQLRGQVRVLGAVDLEIRPVNRAERPEVPEELARRWKPEPLPESWGKLSQLLRNGRMRMALSFRDASALSHRIADTLGDGRYSMSVSSLSDYEARDTPPRHLHKVITLCLLYAVRFRTFLNTVGITPEEAGEEAIPDRFIPRQSPAGPHGSFVDAGKLDCEAFLGELIRQCEDIPLFLRGSTGALSGLASPSLRDFYWVGGVRNALHPYLRNGLLAIVDRNKKKPLHSTSKPLWQQPLYVVLKRDGTYLCGCCGRENGMLVIHHYSEHFHRPEEFRIHHDAEVVGRVVTLVRRLL